MSEVCLSLCLPLSLSLSVSPDVLLAARALKASSLGFSDKKPAAPVVRCTQRADEATTDGQTDDEELLNWDRLFLAPLDVIHPVAGNKKKILFVVDVIHPVSQEHFFFPFCSSHGCYSSILLQKLFFFGSPPLFIVPMDVVHPICKRKLILFWVHWDRLFVVPIGCHPQNFLFNNINKCLLLSVLTAKSSQKHFVQKHALSAAIKFSGFGW